MKKIRTIALIASIIGFIDSTYLAYVKFAHAQIYCTPGLGDCASVQNSQWSEIWGVPIAVFGALSYLVLAICFLTENKINPYKQFFQYMVWGISFFGFIYSLYLTWLELFVIHALCQWCILSALCMTIIFIVTIIRLKVTQYQPYQ